MNYDRLRTLSAKLREVHAKTPDKFDLTFWRARFATPEDPEADNWQLSNDGQYVSDNALQNECGTAACAIGWACAIPEFKAAGFRWQDTGDGRGYPEYVRPGFEALEGFVAAGRFFGISQSVCRSLFLNSGYGQPVPGKTRINVTAEQVADAIDSLITYPYPGNL